MVHHSCWVSGDFTYGDIMSIYSTGQWPEVKDEPKTEPNAKPLVDKRSEVLRQVTPKFNFQNPPMDPYELYRELGEALQKHGGLGLAAPQIGYPYRVFVIRSSPIIPFFNPIIVDASEETVEMDEGCLTFPGILLKIQRPRVIRVRYTDPNGTTETKKFQDMTARVIQHELDHLNGVLFGSHAGPMQLDVAIRKAKKSGYSYIKSDLK